MTDLPIGRGQPRREAALRWLSWRWRGVSRPEGEVAAACGRLLSTCLATSLERLRLYVDRLLEQLLEPVCRQPRR